jgi:uncharacterized membrane protein (DUF373 family)
VNRLASILATILDHSDATINGIIGLSFLGGGLFALVYSFWDVGTIMIERTASEPTAPSFVALAIIKFISDLLLVLIIMEVLRTIIHYLKEHTTSLQPFLFIGIVSATRSILSIGARLAVENLSNPDFIRAMIELGSMPLSFLSLVSPSSCWEHSSRRAKTGNSREDEGPTSLA